MVSDTVAIKNILVMSDCSPTSERTLRYAVDWARVSGAMVHVAHFIRPMAYALAGAAYAELMNRLWQEGRESLAAIDDGEILREVPHAAWLDPGEILDGLPALISAHQIDLLVLASVGRLGLRKVVLGSTAEAVFRTTGCPVLMVGPGVADARPRGPGVVLLATDFGPAASRAAAYAFSLARQRRARLHLLHVLRPPVEAGSLCAAEVNTAQARLLALAPLGAEPGERNTIVHFGRPAEEIASTAREIGADLVVLGARRAPQFTLYSGWATAYEVLGDVPCPVLMLREPAGGGEHRLPLRADRSLPDAQAKNPAGPVAVPVHAGR